MGEAKRRSARLARFIDEPPWCCFCGGTTPAQSMDLQQRGVFETVEAFLALFPMHADLRQGKWQTDDLFFIRYAHGEGQLITAAICHELIALLARLFDPPVSSSIEHDDLTASPSSTRMVTPEGYLLRDLWRVRQAAMHLLATNRPLRARANSDMPMPAAGPVFGPAPPSRKGEADAGD